MSNHRIIAGDWLTINAHSIYPVPSHCRNLTSDWLFIVLAPYHVTTNICHVTLVAKLTFLVFFFYEPDRMRLFFYMVEVV